MPIISNPFSGRLNLDDADFRILGRGDYIDAVNVTRDSPGEGQDTVVSNNIGNLLIPYTLPSGTNKVIGSREDKKRNRLYYFVWNSTKKHSVLYYDANRNYVVKVLENMTDTGQVDILEFNPSFKITSINVLYRDFEGDLLFFSDGNVDPKCINVSAVYSVWTKQEILVIKAPPKMPPQVAYENDLLVTQNNLRNSLFQFCYRYVYDTLDKSVWSTRSIVPLPQQNTLNYTSNLFKENSRISVNFSTGGQSVRGIELAFRQTTAGITSDWKLIQLFDKANLGIPDNSIYSFRFYNDSVYTPIDIRETDLLQDYVPLKANASELANGNALLYAGITEGFDKTNMNLIGTSSTSQLSNNYFDKCGVSFFATINGETSGTFSGSSATELKVYLFGTGTNNGANEVSTLNNAAGVYCINMLAGTTNISVTFTVSSVNSVTSSILGGLSSQLLAKNMTFVSLTNNVLTVRLNNTFATAYSTNTIILCSSGVRYLSASGEPDNTVFANSWESGYTYAIQYFDNYGRTIGAQTSLQATFYTPAYPLSNTINLPITQIQIYNRPPKYASYYQILRSNSTTYFKRLFWVSNSAFQGSSVNNVKYAYIGIENILVYNESISSTENVISYEYTKGDRIRFLSRYEVNGNVQLLTNKFYDYEILGTELEINSVVSNSTKKKNGIFIKINYPSSDIDANFNFSGTEDYQNYQIIIYNYEKAADKRLYYEFGKQFSIGNAGTDNAFHLGLEQNQSTNLVSPAIISTSNGDLFYRKRKVTTSIDFALRFLSITTYAIGYKNYSFAISSDPNWIINSNYEIQTQLPYIINVTGSGFPTWSVPGFYLFRNKSTTNSLNIRFKFSGTATYTNAPSNDNITYKILALIVSNAGVPVSPKYTVLLESFTALADEPKQFNIDTTIEIPKQSFLYIIGEYPVSGLTSYIVINTENIQLSVVGNQTINIIESSFSDNMNLITNSNGRPSAIEENARQTYFPTMIRFGQEYQLNTILNNINRFYPEDFDEYDLSYGEVVRLHIRDRQLIVYQNHKVGRVPILTQIIKDVTGDPLQANSDKLINKIQYYAGDYGIGDAATSLAWNNFSDYFVDNFRGIVCRLSQDGITPLSVLYKTNGFFTSKLLQYRKELNNGLTINGNPCIYGVFDSMTNKYIIALEEINRYSSCDFNGGVSFIVPTTTSTTTTSTTSTTSTTTTTTTTTTLPICTSYTNGSTENWVGDYQLCNGTWVYSGTVNPGNSICAVIGSPFTLSGVDLTAVGQCGLYVGQSALGGIIAYILQPGDAGYDANVQHGLIASTSDIVSNNWWNGSNTTTGATAGFSSFVLGAGFGNTNAIISSQGAGTYAATLCRNFTGGGYNDWYLPSSQELQKLYNNRAIIGGFGNQGYWTSNETDSSQAYYLFFFNGSIGSSSKSSGIPTRVRPVRSF
jgi:hypothetical protein